jgi:Protein of unknown function (DUF4235)
MLKAPAAMVASVAVQGGLRAGWRLVTGAGPPAAPDDRRVPLGQAVAWAVLFGGAVTTARMIAGRYVSAWLLPGAQRQGPAEPGRVGSSGPQVPARQAPGLPYLVAVAVLAWRRRR